eukprot:NODE_15_length_50561_cov_0.608081.p21 type:complete len:307 gc:universal NODE_15_length_50561_cov_0.608081:44630-43710(-)
MRIAAKTPLEIMKYYASATEPETVFILLPGNPGCSDLYLDFMEYLHQRYEEKVDIYSIDYLGHTTPSPEQFLIEHQLEYCRRKILSIKFEQPNAKIYLFGHSLGGYLALRLESLADRIVLLFPAIDDLKNTENAKMMWFLFTPMGIFIMSMLSWLLEILPLTVKFHLAHYVEPRLGYDQRMIVSRIFHHRVVANAVGLSRDEFDKIKPLDMAALGRHKRQDSSLDEDPVRVIDKCYFVFAPFDGWCKINTYRNLCNEFPDKIIEKETAKESEKGGIYLTDSTIPHAFILGHHRPVVDIIRTILPEK